MGSKIQLRDVEPTPFSETPPEIANRRVKSPGGRKRWQKNAEVSAEAESAVRSTAKVKTKKTARTKTADAAEEARLFKADARARTGMEPRMKKLVCLMIAAAALYCIIQVVPFPVPNSWDYLLEIHYDAATYTRVFKSNITYIGYVLAGQNMTEFGDIIGVNNKAREMLCGICALVVGAGLAVTGAVFQGSFRNSIASPTTLGVMSGGTLGSTIYIMWGSEWFGGKIGSRLAETTGMLGAGRFLFVLAGCLGAVLFTTSLSRLTSHGKQVSTVAIIVVGMVFSSAVSTVSQYISMMVNATDPYGAKAADLQTAMVGHMNASATWLLVICIGIILTIFILLGKRLNLLVFGEDEARALGIHVERTRRLMMALCTLMTALIIATCGGISFLGLIIPHITRRMVGSDFRYLIPGSALVGGIFLLFCDWLPPFSWMSGSGYVGNYTSIVGGALFLFMIIRNRRAHNADWA